MDSGCGFCGGPGVDVGVVYGWNLGDFVWVVSGLDSGGGVGSMWICCCFCGEI